VRLYTRNGYDFADRFPGISDQAFLRGPASLTARPLWSTSALLRIGPAHWKRRRRVTPNRTRPRLQRHVDQLDIAGQTILKLLHKAAGVTEVNGKQALEMAQKLSDQLEIIAAAQALTPRAPIRYLRAM
jgi:hypothetical protein